MCFCVGYFCPINNLKIQPNYNYKRHLDACLCQLRNKMIFFLHLCFNGTVSPILRFFINWWIFFFMWTVSTKANIIFIFKHWSRSEQTTNFASHESFEAKIIASTHTHPHAHVIPELKEKCDKAGRWIH